MSRQGEDEVTFDPKSTALLLIECQNDFMSDGGVFYPDTRHVIEKTGMIDNALRALAVARSAEATVMHAPISFTPGYRELNPKPYGILKGVVDGGALVKGEWGSQFFDALAPRDGDIVIEGKRGLDTFASTNLDFILRSRGMKTLVVGGFLTNCCVEGTMRSGYERGFDVVSLTDCMGATSVEEHENALKYTFPMFSTLSTAAEFVAEMR
jgi:nicotinamidase-related amidase